MDKSVGIDSNVFISGILRSHGNYSHSRKFFEEAVRNHSIRPRLFRSVKEELNVWLDKNGMFLLDVASRVVGRPPGEMGRILNSLYLEEVQKRNGRENLVRFFESIYALPEGKRIPPNTPTKIYEEVISVLRDAFRGLNKDLDYYGYEVSSEDLSPIYKELPHFKEEPCDAMHLASCIQLRKSEKCVEFATWDEKDFHKGFKPKIRKNYDIGITYPSDYFS